RGAASAGGVRERAGTAAGRTVRRICLLALAADAALGRPGRASFGDDLLPPVLARRVPGAVVRVVRSGRDHAAAGLHPAGRLPEERYRRYAWNKSPLCLNIPRGPRWPPPRQRPRA